MKKTLGMLLLFVAVSASCFAATTVPEVDPASAGSVIALVTGAVLVIRSRKK